jgi:hypothetical protein
MGTNRRTKPAIDLQTPRRETGGVFQLEAANNNCSRHRRESYNPNNASDEIHGSCALSGRSAMCRVVAAHIPLIGAGVDQL